MALRGNSFIFDELRDVRTFGTLALMALDKLGDQEDYFFSDEVGKIKNCRFQFIKGDRMINIFSF